MILPTAVIIVVVKWRSSHPFHIYNLDEHSVSSTHLFTYPNHLCTSTCTDGYLFYPLGYNPLLLLFYCSHYSSFGHLGAFSGLLLWSFVLVCFVETKCHYSTGETDLVMYPMLSLNLLPQLPSVRVTGMNHHTFPVDFDTALSSL